MHTYQVITPSNNIATGLIVINPLLYAESVFGRYVTLITGSSFRYLTDNWLTLSEFPEILCFKSSKPRDPGKA